MPSFRYTAITPAGETSTGLMEAPSEQAVIDILRRQGSLPMRAEPADGARSPLSSLLGAEFGGPPRLSGQDLAEFTRELAVMLGAGQDLDRALRFLVDTAARKKTRAILTQIRDAVRDGSPFATALTRHPASFPNLYIGLVRAGEAGGMLANTLERLADLLEKNRTLRASIVSSLIYPIILLVAGIGSIVLLLTQVLPQFVPMFEQAGAALPRATQIVIDMGDFVSNYGLYAAAACVALFFAARAALARPGPRMWWDRMLLRIPVIGPLAREVLAARFARTLGTLLQNGVPLVSSLGIVGDVIGNTAAAAAVRSATESAKGGAGLARPMQISGIFPVRTIYLLRLGEETAQLGGMSLRAAEIHEAQSAIGIQRVTALLVPVLILIMGMAVAGIVSSLLLAMLSLNDLAK